MTGATKTEYDMRNVQAARFYQDARPGDKFRVLDGPFPERTYELLWFLPSFEMDGEWYFAMAVRWAPYVGTHQDQALTVEVDDRIIWYKQVPWKGLTD